MKNEEGESGTSPEPLSEAEIILQEIEEKMKSAKIDLVSILVKESEQQKNECKSRARNLKRFLSRLLGTIEEKMVAKCKNAVAR